MKRDSRDRLEIIPCQSSRIDRLGLTREECSRCVWLLGPETGLRLRGAEAILASLALVWRRPRLARLYRLPFLGMILDLLYACTAAVRHRLPGSTPYCTRYPERCR